MITQKECKSIQLGVANNAIVVDLSYILSYSNMLTTTTNSLLFYWQRLAEPRFNL